MAEIFATASAAIGVAAAAGQLIDGITKLKAFCTEIRDVPDEIQETTEDLFMLIGVLEAVRREIGQLSSLSEPELGASGRVLVHLQRGLQHVGEVLLEMQEKIRKKKRWDRVRAVGMKRKLEKSVSRVQSVQNLLLVILTTETRAMLRRNMDAQHQELLAVSTAITTASSSHKVINQAGRHLIVATGQHSHGIKNKDLQDGVSVVRKSNRRTFEATSSKPWTLRLRFPTWLLSRAWDLSVHQANQGWDFKLRSYNIRPRDANIFRAIVDQNIVRVRELLARAEASIYDRDTAGLTALHYAARKCCSSANAAAIFEFLIESGADINATDEEGRPVHLLLPHNLWIDDGGPKELCLVKCY
ncbi:MAG: hypothetical protein M1821_001203 [Bathelium mastoideum]|nr:MAG: hypothetical protein M1821_001203 [Bathelium mastoideum]